MTARSTTRFRDRVSAACKYCLSFRKQEWELRDYPISICAEEFDPRYTAPRFKQHRYIASIVKLPLCGCGNTQQEAMRDLAASFARAKAERKTQGKRLPRPGTGVPVQFASQERIDTHRDLADDFIRRVLDLEWAWVSDESSLWDFHTDETNEALLAKVKKVYGVDVSDIESARLSEILDRIAEMQASK